LESAYLIDAYAEGKDTGIIDLFLVGNINQYHLNDLSRKTEQYIKQKIRSLVLSQEEYNHLLPELEKIRPGTLIAPVLGIRKRHSSIFFISKSITYLLKVPKVLKVISA